MRLRHIGPLTGLVTVVLSLIGVGYGFRHHSWRGGFVSDSIDHTQTVDPSPTVTHLSPRTSRPSPPSATQAIPTTPSVMLPGVTRGMLVAAPGCALPPDPSAGRPVVASREEPVPGASNLVRCIRIVQTTSKYPLWRVEELLVRDPKTGIETARARSVMVANHILVRLQEGVDVGRFEALVARSGAKTIRKLHSRGFCLMGVPQADPDTVTRLLAALDGQKDLIRYAEPDHILHAVQNRPNDSRFASLWALDNTGQSGGTPDADIDAPEAWEIATGNSEVVTAIIDTGVDFNHPDIVSNIWSNPLETVNGIDDDGNGFIDDIRGWDFANGDNSPFDDYSHGTHVAGTIAATGNNGVGVVGVNWQGRILALKFLDSSGSGTTSDAVDALHYVAGLRRSGINIRLTNNSWGGGGETALSEAIREQGDAGILFVAAAGNSGSDNDAYPFYPAGYPWSNIIAVAATDRRDNRPSFSQYGRTSVDLAAPGADILSTVPGGGYGLSSGTSMATPHVSGVAALLWSTWPDATWQDVRDAILSGTDPIASMSGMTVTGGRLNAYKALLRLFRILHTPNTNTYNAVAPYEITATVGPERLVDTNALYVFWNADGSTNFSSRPMSEVRSTLYRGSIPMQPEGTTISYWIEATPTSGQSVRLPTNAPAALYSFRITPPLDFTVSATPDLIASVAPDYGRHTYPSGVVIRATADACTDPVDSARWACAGWTGNGSAPVSGDSNAVTFELSRESTVEWRWREEYALVQSANIGGIHATTTWWSAGSSGATLSAAAAISRGGTNYAFVHWQLDGRRQPDAVRTAVNPVIAIPMAAPHRTEAIYMDTRLDADNDGIRDWWEYSSFGSTNAQPADDADGDGFPNLDEYLDRTDPQDRHSQPIPPVIIHTPLSSPQDHPAPYGIQATITDNFSVASVALLWSRSGLPFTQAYVSPGAVSHSYTTCIPEPGIQGDTFVYLLLATDARGSVTTNGPHSFRVDYPLLNLRPAVVENTLRPDIVSNVQVSVSNSGTTNLVLEARLRAVGFADDGERGTNGWVHGGAGDVWTLATNRFVSGSNAWYCGDTSASLYTRRMHATLDSPPLILGRGAQLAFWQWIKCERDVQENRAGWKPGYAWDGGIVEISTNSGRSFMQIAPTGNYSHKISGWDQSPWTQDTPCFAGTGGWQRVTFALDAFAQNAAIIRFHFGSDDNTQEEGWYLDDIVVTPDSRSNLWVTLAPSHLDVPAGGQTNLVVTFNSSGIPSGDRQSVIQIACNDPHTPTCIVPVVMHVRSPAVLSGFQAAQTSTHGEGLVTVSNLVRDVDGDTCALDLGWSANGGASWSDLPILSARDTPGLATLSASISPQVENVKTSNNGLGFTNSLTLTWNTSGPGSGIVFSPNVIVRARVWDGLYWSDWTASQPFMVDNKPPESPGRVWSITHATSSWSTNPILSVRWQTAKDGVGVGVAGYDYGAGPNPPICVISGNTSNHAVNSFAIPDGSNWFMIVRARDFYGNVSTPTVAGPYWIDTAPPSAANATVTLAHSQFGNYLVGPTSMQGAWTGFSDAASGIRNYYCAFSNRAGSTNGLRTPATTSALSNAQIGVINTLYVWAEDQAGLIGPAASASCLVLDPLGDQDGDHLSNTREEVSGTDACDPSSVLRLSATQASPGNGFILRWPAVSNRSYSLDYRDSLLSGTNWTSVPGFSAVPGINGTMTHTDRTAVLPSRFYRITVRSP